MLKALKMLKVFPSTVVVHFVGQANRDLLQVVCAHEQRPPHSEREASLKTSDLARSLPCPAANTTSVVEFLGHFPQVQSPLKLTWRQIRRRCARFWKYDFSDLENPSYLFSQLS